MKKIWFFAITVATSSSCQVEGMLARRLAVPHGGILSSTLAASTTRPFASWHRGNSQHSGTDAESVVNDFAEHIRETKEAALYAYLVDQSMDRATARQVAEQQARRIVERLRRAPLLIKAKSAQEVEEILAAYHAKNGSTEKE